MTITVLDTQTGIDEILRAPVASCPGLLKSMLEPMAGMYRYFPGEADLVALHSMGLGIPLDGNIEVVSEGLADAFARQIYGDELGYTRIGVPHLNDDDVFNKVITGLEGTGMQKFTSWVHGDAAATRFGVPPVGLPGGADYAAGNRLVDAYLERTGRHAADALHIDSQEIISVALDR